MGKLHELLAVEGDLSGAAEKIIAEAQDTFGKRERFTGSIKKLEMFDAERANEEVTEHTVITTTVAEKLKYIQEPIIRYLDAFLQKEKTNQTAKADIVIDGVTVASDVPATALLGLETKLKSIRAVYEKIPTLAPGVEWKKNENTGEYEKAHPDVKSKTEKTMEPVVLYPHTDKHPAQVEKITKDVAVGKYTTTETSGMISPIEKSVLLGRVDALLRAVKKARQRANTTDVVDASIGKALFDYIHA